MELCRSRRWSSWFYWGTAVCAVVVVSASETIVNADGSFAASRESVLDDIDNNNKIPRGYEDDDDDEDEDSVDEYVKQCQAQVDWIRSKGGFVSSKIEIRRQYPGDASTRLGMFAATDIDEGDLLLSIPRSCLLTSEAEEPDWVCNTMRNLVREWKLGNASEYAPYTNYLKLPNPFPMPSDWSDYGQHLLLNVTGGSRTSDSQVLPPIGPVGWLDDEYRNDCNGNPNDELEQQAFLTVLQKGHDDFLVPLHDVLQHRNGKWLNTKTTGIRNENADVEIVASKPIAKSEELFSSHNQCEDCAGRARNYGTGEILRDYGIVEDYPQKWIFHNEGVSFTLEKDDENDETELRWHSRPPTDEDDLDFFEEQLERLNYLYGKTMANHNAWIPESEMNVLGDYTSSLMEALEKVLEVARGVTCDADGAEDGTCRVSDSRYSALNEPFDEYDISTCDKSVSLDFSFYDTIEEIKSHYQMNTFIKNPKNQNTCFDLDDVYQICGSYRPHYHEMVVHYTARFLPNVQRVLWVGGGDSMLLHEVLKYRNLEFVVGLEIDQKVTRWAFKHFGTQPHYDNEKVQWWYGDAAKSLLMIPKSWFGTFDLVLVDLSETIMSATVTKQLDIMAALSLLLKKDGILVKNELYFEKLNPIFKHTVQLHYADVPVICSQCLCLGSNGIDFVNQGLTDHGVETLFAPLDQLDESFETVHDFMNNPSAQRHCATDEEEEEPEEQEKSPGIAMVLEAENVSVDLVPSSKLQSVIVPALEQEGLTVVSTIPVDDDGKGPVLVVVLQEGYVVARTWPAQQYCAFDIHLWSRFEKQEDIKKALLAAVGSQSPSSFRIVAGGMFGIDTWKEDYKSRGPKFTQDCNEPAKAFSNVPMDPNQVDTILNELVGFGQEEESSVLAVLCGPEGDACHAAELLAQHKNVRKVVPIHACSGIEKDMDYLEDAANRKFSCENELLERLTELTAGDDNKLSTFVLDQSAPYALAQVINKIGKRGKNRKAFFEEDLLVVAPVVDKSEEWRKIFVDEFRGIAPVEPAFMADVWFNSTQSSLEVSVFLSGDEHFITHFKDLASKIEEKTGLVGDVRLVGGGKFTYQEHFKASQWFLPSDYDQTSPYEQWQSQQPTGHQSITQLESKNKAGLSKEAVRNLVDKTLEDLNIATVSPPREFTDIGDGSVTVVIFSEGTGHAVILFDGRNHVSLNIFTFEEGTDLAANISTKFQELDESLSVSLFDEMPRGHGRVVNWSKDIFPRHEPHWALHMTTSKKDE